MISIDTTELKPCPFCGQRPRTHIGWNIHPTGNNNLSLVVFSIKCDNCHISRECIKEIGNTNFSENVNMMNRAIEMWNERV